MNITENVSLRDYSTMRLGGPARYLVSIENRNELVEAIGFAKQQQVPFIVIGGGSNIVWQDDGFPGLVIVNKIERYETFEEDETNSYITAGAGEVWDTVVERCAQAGLTGIEALSLIPGSTGATPVQNVGAYGQDISQTLTTVEAYDTEKADFVNIPASECAFGYRTSRFKTSDRGRYVITAITLHLQRGSMHPPFYASLDTYLKLNYITDYSPMNIRKAVIDIRSSKLPDPAVVNNNGSFWANPIISSEDLVRIRAGYPEIPSWTMPDGRAKLSAAWLIDQAGFKDFKDEPTGMATWQKQPLVLVNEKAKSTADLLQFKQKIEKTVQDKFGVQLIQEPELLPL